MVTCGGITPPSSNPLVYIDRISPATAGASRETNRPVVPCQMAACEIPPPEVENSLGAAIDTTGRNRVALDPPAIRTLPSGSNVDVPAAAMSTGGEKVPL